ncbi:MAG: hypothetical protein HYX52_04570 [Chloroflexi bacterium]|nr:hypothetical protein [Chloroflexota bacterium]
MAYPSPPNRPPGFSSSDWSNRLPWIALGLGLLIIIGAGVALLVLSSPDRRRDVSITLNADPTPTRPTATLVAAPPPTVIPPTVRATSTPAPLSTPTPVRPPAATAANAVTPAAPAATTPPPTAPPALAPPPAAPTATAVKGVAPAGAATPLPPPTARPAGPTSAGTTPPSAPSATPSPPPQPTSPPAPPSPTAFAGQVSLPGGLANTIQDLQAAFGPPVGETGGKLAVYRKGTTEYRADLTPDLQRAVLVAEELPPSSPVALEAAVQESRKLLPRDAQPRATAPEGNAIFVVERFASPALTQALPADLWTAQRKGQPGDLLVVYLKNAQGAITRIIVGIGDDPDVLLQRSGE